MENLLCDSPLGDGRIRLAGDWPGNGGMPHFSVELDRIPVAAGLDALRTVRRGLAPGIEAAGAASGNVAYAEIPADSPAQKKSASAGKAAFNQGGQADVRPRARSPAALPSTGFQLSGDGLSRPILAPKMVLSRRQGASTGPGAGWNRGNSRGWLPFPSR